MEPCIPVKFLFLRGRGRPRGQPVYPRCISRTQRRDHTQKPRKASSRLFLSAGSQARLFLQDEQNSPTRRCARRADSKPHSIRHFFSTSFRSVSTAESISLSRTPL